MPNKIQKHARVNKDALHQIVCVQEGLSPIGLAALDSNIKDSFDEIDALRGTVQYWESRGAVGDPKERDLIIEAYRIIHGELLGLTARMKELRDRAEMAAGSVEPQRELILSA
jgi:hypothetical protein